MLKSRKYQFAQLLDLIIKISYHQKEIITSVTVYKTPKGVLNKN